MSEQDMHFYFNAINVKHTIAQEKCLYYFSENKHHHSKLFAVTQ